MRMPRRLRFAPARRTSVWWEAAEKTKYVREKLEAQGFTGEQLDSVYAPIGIEIGSETPAEIAISIAAQLIQIRSAKTGKRKGAHPALHT